MTARCLTYRAWRVGDGADAVPVPVDAAGSLAQAVERALVRATHKQALLVEERDCVTERTVLHAYRVRQKARAWRYNPETKTTDAVTPLFADALFSVPVAAFDPVEVWRWTPGADVVGAAPRVIQHT